MIIYLQSVSNPNKDAILVIRSWCRDRRITNAVLHIRTGGEIAGTDLPNFSKFFALDNERDESKLYPIMHIDQLALLLSENDDLQVTFWKDSITPTCLTVEPYCAMLSEIASIEPIIFLTALGKAGPTEQDNLRLDVMELLNLEIPPLMRREKDPFKQSTGVQNYGHRTNYQTH